MKCRTKQIWTSMAMLALFVGSSPAESEEPIVFDADAQAALTPDAVLENLMAGNARYVAGELTHAEHLNEQVAATVSGQYPQAIILSCVDSRVPVEMVFDQGLGDIFVARVAGNVENVDILGSMEFAAVAAGSKLIMVLGHQSCGAISGACDYVQMGNLTSLLEKLEPALQEVQKQHPEMERSSENAAFVEHAVRTNVERTVADIRRNSPVLAEMEAEGAIKIVGAYYSLEDGSVSLLH